MLARSEGQSLLERVKQALGEVNWKHVVILSIPLGLYLYPAPLLRLFMPIASKLNSNHPAPTLSPLAEIILTPNPDITLASLPKLHFLKGAAPSPSPYPQEECATIELFPEDRRGNVSSSFSGVQQVGSEQTMNLYCQTLWNSFRITRLQQPQLRVILIKASQEVLNRFLLRFYRLTRKEAHKIGFLSEKRLSILRLDPRVGTYEHLVGEFQ